MCFFCLSFDYYFIWTKLPELKMTMTTMWIVDSLKGISLSTI